MKSLFISALVGVCMCGMLSAQPTNTGLSGGAFFDGEPYLAVNPVNNENMVIAWMSYVPNSGIPLLDQIGIRVKSSFDGGISWGNEVMMPHFSKTFHSADVSMAFHHDGTLYIEYIDYRQNPDSGVIVVSHSTDGGKTWSLPKEAFNLYDNNDRPIDRPWIAIDNSGTASDGTIYITTKPVSWDPLPNRPYMKYSVDGGATWSKIDTVDGGNYPAGMIPEPMAAPGVSADGMFRAAYLSWSLKNSLYPRMTLASSSDYGKSYMRTTMGMLTSGGAGKDTLSKLGYRLALKPNDAKNMLFAWIDSREGDNDVYAVTSADGGATWNNALRINDDPKNNGIWQDLVWADYSDNGKCIVSWRDRRNGDSTGYEKGSDIYFAVSTDDGKTFGKNIRLSDRTAPHNKVLNSPGNDFHCSVIVHDSICATWGDVRTGKLTVYFAKASLGDGIAKVVQVSQDENNFSVHPNPAAHSVSIECILEEPCIMELSINDVNGKVIWHEVAERTNNLSRTIDLSRFSEGVYTIIMKTSGEIFEKKFTVVR